MFFFSSRGLQKRRIVLLKNNHSFNIKGLSDKSADESTGGLSSSESV